MKTNFFSFLSISTVASFLLTGCASYNALSLNGLSSDFFVHPSTSAKKDDVVIAAKAFNYMDCKRYLDRDVLQKGYQPIQLYIQNNSDKSYSFSLNRITLPYVSHEEVAAKVHTSTVGRVLAYGIPGVLVVWPLIIPAVIDGMKSSEANELLDNDFSAKAARDQLSSRIQAIIKFSLFPRANINLHLL